jgi:hypothetical protein
MTKEEARSVWDAAWSAALATEKMRAQLEPDEHFACEPREWCFELWAARQGYDPPEIITVPTTLGFCVRRWNKEKREYE